MYLQESTLQELVSLNQKLWQVSIHSVNKKDN